MPILHVRNVPENLYTRLKERARIENRSLSAEIITLLELALQEQDRPAMDSELLARIRRRRWSPPENTPSSVELLREDRGR
ncbi:MAG: hypothetical protein U0822_21850 [Anaerolineae bacterium]